MKRFELLNKISSPARIGYDIINEMVQDADNTTDLYNDLENSISELKRALNNLSAVADIELDLED